MRTFLCKVLNIIILLAWEIHSPDKKITLYLFRTIKLIIIFITIKLIVIQSKMQFPYRLYS